MTDDAPLELTGSLCREHNQSAWSQHCLFVFDQRSNLGGLDTKTLQASCRIETQFVGFACRQCDGTEFGHDDAVITNLGSQQGDVTTQGRFQLAFVEDAAGGPVAAETIAPGHEFIKTELVCGGDESADVDGRTRRKIKPARIGKVHLSIGGQSTENLARIVALDAVEEDTIGRRLPDIDVGLAADIKGVPIDGGPGGTLIDGHGGLLPADGRGATYHLFSCRQLGRRRWLGESSTMSGDQCDHQQAREMSRVTEPSIPSICVVWASDFHRSRGRDHKPSPNNNDRHNSAWRCRTRP